MDSPCHSKLFFHKFFKGVHVTGPDLCHEVVLSDGCVNLCYFPCFGQLLCDFSCCAYVTFHHEDGGCCFTDLVLVDPHGESFYNAFFLQVLDAFVNRHV